jgi:hypothetical protein
MVEGFLSVVGATDFDDQIVPTDGAKLFMSDFVTGYSDAHLLAK